MPKDEGDICYGGRTIMASRHPGDVGLLPRGRHELLSTLRCNLSGKLPTTPVNAEDGHLCNKPDIESWIRKHHGRHLRSPVTGLLMGPRLYPVVHALSFIQHSVEEQLMPSREAITWRVELDNCSVRRDAKGGDPEALYELGRRYLNGSQGIKTNPEVALACFQRASDAKFPPATAVLGMLHLEGRLRDHVHPHESFIWLAAAAAQKSRFAAFLLAECYLQGWCGLTVDLEEAHNFLVTSVEVEDSSYYSHEMNEQRTNDALSLMKHIEKQAQGIATDAGKSPMADVEATKQDVQTRGVARPWSSPCDCAFVPNGFPEWFNGQCFMCIFGSEEDKTAWEGWCFLTGQDNTTKDQPHGLIKTSTAYVNGSRCAALVLGCCYSSDGFGVPVDFEESLKFITAATNESTSSSNYNMEGICFGAKHLLEHIYEETRNATA